MDELEWLKAYSSVVFPFKFETALIHRRFTYKISDDLLEKKGLWFGWLERNRLCVESEKCSIAGGASIVHWLLCIINVYCHSMYHLQWRRRSPPPPMPPLMSILFDCCTVSVQQNTKWKKNIMMTSFRYYCCINNFYLTVSQRLMLLLPIHKISNAR